MTLQAFHILTAAHFQELDLGNSIHEETVKGNIANLRVNLKIKFKIFILLLGFWNGSINFDIFTKIFDCLYIVLIQIFNEMKLTLS